MFKKYNEGGKNHGKELYDSRRCCRRTFCFKVQGLQDCKEKRTDLKATVDITGRDQQDQKLYLKFEPELCLWKFEKAETELWKEPEDKVLSAVNTYLMEAGCFQGTASELMDKISEINLVPNQLTRQLNIKAGRLYEDYGIRYDNKRCHDGRIITLEYEKE